MKFAEKEEGVKSVTDYFLVKRREDICPAVINHELFATAGKELIGDPELSST